MKNLNKIKIGLVFVFLLGIAFGNQSYGQTTTWVFDAGDNSGGRVKITTVGSDESVSKVQLATKGDQYWTDTDILEMDTYETYIRIKSQGSGRTYELAIDWYDGKLIFTRPEGTTITYWLHE